VLDLDGRGGSFDGQGDAPALYPIRRRKPFHHWGRQIRRHDG
jgi:hypothetical protein